ncbi:MAG: DUF927 domain-containing protein [Eubacteriales bacterium]
MQELPQTGLHAIEIDYGNLTADDLISNQLFDTILSQKDTMKINQAAARCGVRASELKIKRSFDRCFKTYKMQIEQCRGTASVNKTDFWEQPYTLRCGNWTADDTGVYILKKDYERKTIKETASPIPIMVTEVLTNISTKIEKVKLEFYKNFKWRSIIVERATISSSNKIIELANQGIEVTSESAKLLVRYLSDLINMNIDIIPQNKAISRLGWIEEKFIPYANNIRYDGENNFINLYNSVTSAGSFDTWQSMTAELRKSIIIRLTMAASFASPIIELIDALPFIFHLWGATETGKTVSLRIAASIWGNSQPGKYVKNLNMTQNAMLSTAAFLKNLPFVCDELQVIKSNWDNFDKLIMTFTQGEGRALNRYDKTLEALSWKNCLITSGEEPIVKTNSGGGAVNRVIEIITDKKIIDDGRGVINNLDTHYGTAGKKYITALINTGKTELQKINTGYYSEIIKMKYTTDKQAASMALILTADKIASELLYPNEIPLTPADIKQFLTSSAEVDVSERAYRFIVNHIAVHENKFMGLENGEKWGRIEEGTAIINKEILERELADVGIDFNAIKKRWIDNKHVLLNSASRINHNRKENNSNVDYIKIVLQSDEQIEIDKEPFT